MSNFFRSWKISVLLALLWAVVGIDYVVRAIDSTSMFRVLTVILVSYLVVSCVLQAVRSYRNPDYPFSIGNWSWQTCLFFVVWGVFLAGTLFYGLHLAIIGFSLGGIFVSGALLLLCSYYTVICGQEALARYRNRIR